MDSTAGHCSHTITYMEHYTNLAMIVITETQMQSLFRKVEMASPEHELIAATN